MALDPASAISLATNVTNLMKTLFGVAKEQQRQEVKDQIIEVIDALQELKLRAVELEDQNRELKEKLRFKSDDFDYREPFYFEKSKPNVLLCPRCFVEHKRAAPMSYQVRDDDGTVFRKCNVCDKITYEQRGQPRPYNPPPDFGPWS